MYVCMHACMHVCMYVSFSLNSSGPGGTSGAHTTCCEKVAGPPASSPGVCLHRLPVPA